MLRVHYGLKTEALRLDCTKSEQCQTRTKNRLLRKFSTYRNSKDLTRRTIFDLRDWPVNNSLVVSAWSVVSVRPRPRGVLHPTRNGAKVPASTRLSSDGGDRLPECRKTQPLQTAI
jgi:hypothetical protein